jgi:hypothetical protein
MKLKPAKIYRKIVFLHAEELVVYLLNKRNTRYLRMVQCQREISSKACDESVVADQQEIT